MVVEKLCTGNISEPDSIVIAVAEGKKKSFATDDNFGAKLFRLRIQMNSRNWKFESFQPLETTTKY